MLSLLSSLLSIDSTNPDLVPGGVGEAAVAQCIVEWAHTVGLEATVQQVVPGRPNVVITARGSGGGRSLMFNGHTDVVDSSGMTAPFSPRIENGRMYGRGAYDMKGGLTAALIAAQRAKSLSLRGDVHVSCVVDEEVASIGSQAVVREMERWPADVVVVVEPTDEELVVAHKGFVWLEVETRGRSAHGSRPVISGGQEMSSYPAKCRLQVERRTVPGEDVALAQNELHALFATAAHDDPDFHAELRVVLHRAPFEVAEDADLVRALQRLAPAHLGHPLTLAGAAYWADSALFQSAGIPTVLLGPRGAGAHADVEWVDLDSVSRCCDLYTALATEMCG
ncbi:MAG: M20/M25/M40 family metallo-hydrolase [Chloroflexi bacterium]|nr:M20/M25/M40 family metallo-hydrolase [Chloroflexota bacterium]